MEYFETCYVPKHGIGRVGAQPTNSMKVKINGKTIARKDYKSEESFREAARRINEQTKRRHSSDQ